MYDSFAQLLQHKQKHVHIEAYKLIVLYSYKQNENNLHMNVFIVYV